MTEFIITSSVLITVLILLRFLFRGKISRRVQYALWGLALLRLLVPFSLFSSPVSVMNAVPESVYNQKQQGYAGLSGGDAVKSASPAAPGEEDRGPAVKRDAGGTDRGRILKLIWAVGGAAVGLWFLCTNLVFYRRIRKTRKAYGVPGCKLPVYLSGSVASPCMFGIFRPSIYLTPKAAEKESCVRYILEHEL
ncbi:MAG: M56 family metallopeptidase, partial [Bacillota bacterium]|nr:M56 family metallopeptidase [Bacillota bacterium]